MYKKEKLVENQFTWPICKDLLFLVLEDRVSDVFVCELVWERLFYTKELSKNNCLLYTSPSPRDVSSSRMPSSA